MEEKGTEEARRRKILDNAEARLRFIKDGVPWRRDEAEKCETVVDNEPVVENDIEKIPKDDCSSNNDALITDPDPITLSSENPSQNSESTESKSFDKVNEPHSLNNISEVKDDIISSNSFIDREASSSGFKSVIEESENNALRERDTSMMSAREESATGLSSISFNARNQSDNTLRTLKALLRESTNERQEHKRKADQQNRNMWMSCFLMLFLGVFTRIAYAVQLSWLFNEAMLVPFITGAVPMIVALARDPPLPSGAIVQVLLMAGVKTTVLRRAFTAFTVMRTFFQLFSVYLISFVFTHQLAISYWHLGTD